MGGFSGSLGPAVGYMWNGKWCLRSKPGMVRNPRTDKQMAHREMFKQEVRLAAELREPVVTGLSAAARESGMTSYNLFVHLNQEAFGWNDEGLTVEWTSLQFSAGPVAPIALGTPSVDEHNVLSVSFARNPLHLATDSLDKVHLYVYCPTLRRGVMAAPAFRNERKVSLMLPDEMQGRELVLYAFAQDPHGRTSSTDVARLTTDNAAATPEAVDLETGEVLTNNTLESTPKAENYTAERSDVRRATAPVRTDPAQLSLW